MINTSLWFSKTARRKLHARGLRIQREADRLYAGPKRGQPSNATVKKLVELLGIEEAEHYEEQLYYSCR